jgi:hypothetical protein
LFRLLGLTVPTPLCFTPLCTPGVVVGMVILPTMSRVVHSEVSHHFAPDDVPVHAPNVLAQAQPFRNVNKLAARSIDRCLRQAVPAPKDYLDDSSMS